MSWVPSQGITVDTAPETPPQADLRSIKVDTVKNEATLTMPADKVPEYRQAMEFYQRAMAGMQQELDRVSQQETIARSRNPIINAVQKLAANLAVQPDQPGFVRALGMTSMQLNPDADALAQMKLPLYQQIAKLAGEQEQALSSQENRRYLASYRQQTGAAALQNAATRVQQTLERAAGARLLTPADVRAIDPNASDEEVATYVEASKYAAKQRQAALDEKKLTAAAMRGNIEAQAFERTQRGRLEQAREKFFGARTDLVKLLGPEQVANLQAKTSLEVARGALTWEQAQGYAENLKLQIDRFNRGSDVEKVRLVNEITQNPLMPEEEKKRQLEIVAKIQAKTSARPVAAPERPAPAAAPAAPALSSGSSGGVLGVVRRGIGAVGDLVNGGAREATVGALGPVVDEKKTIDGVVYVKSQGKWFTQAKDGSLVPYVSKR